MMKKSVILITLCGIVLRFVVSFGILGSCPLVGDGPTYSQQAQQLVDGTLGFTYFPPGTAICLAPFYALFGVSGTVDHLFGVVVSSCLLASIVWLCIVVFGWDKRTVVGTCLAALIPHDIMEATQVSSLPLVAFFLTMATCLAVNVWKQWSWTLWLFCSAFLAAAVITRPASVSIVVVLAAVGLLMVFRKRMPLTRYIAAAAATAIVVAVTVVPWCMHNQARAQGWTIATNTEWNFFLANNPLTPDYKTGHFGQRGIPELDSATQAYLLRFVPSGDPSNCTYAERVTMKDEAVRYILAEPLRTLYRVSNRARSYWGVDYNMTRMVQDDYSLPTASVLTIMLSEAGMVFLLLVLAISAPFLIRRPIGEFGVFFSLIVVAGMLPYLAAFAQPRFHTPAIPLVLVPAAAALTFMVDQPRFAWHTLRSRPLWWALMAALIALQLELTYHHVVLK